MCRIAGIISKQLPVQELTRKVSAMCHVLQHGGPDDEGLYTDADAGICLGHRRLAIIDLSANGHQPMADRQKRIWLTFNGEIYNYLELKATLLKLGARFYTATDTEVIIQAYLHWGTAAFAQLKGMFAFALYDTDTLHQRTYLVRDRSGIKPLYYCTRNGALSFASEVKALKAAGIAQGDNTAWQIRFLTYGHLPEPYTTLKEVFSLPKGSYLCWENASAQFQIMAYAAAVPAATISNAAQAQELIYHSLKSAVKRQLVADAPLGIFLSGGIDSSLLALLANRLEHQQLQYISIYFNEGAYNERRYQEMITRQLSGQQHACLVTYRDFETCLPEILQRMDMPTTDGINSWFISKYASQNGLKAVLSGLGADELFGGYPSFRRIHAVNFLKRLPVQLLARLGAFYNTGYARLAFLKRDHPLAQYFFLRGMFTPAEVADLLNTTPAAVEEVIYQNVPALPEHLTGAEKAGWLETHLYMQNQLLRDTDVMSMSHGLEVRVPFLDEDFTDAVNQVTPALRFAAPPVKQLLLNSFKHLLPEAISNRPKMGFTFPLQQWMQTYAPISNTGNYRTKAARTVVNNFKAGRIHWSKIFALYQLQQHA
ncbi:asparagine synthase (glutamine-hydrolyzing) [Mucilaginibacter sp.]